MMEKIDINEVERNMPSGTPAKMRALNNSGNSIYTTVAEIQDIMVDKLERYRHSSGVTECYSHLGNILCVLLKKVASNTSCWLHVVALGTKGGSTRTMDVTLYLACNYNGGFARKEIKVTGSVLFGTCTYNGESYYCLCDNGYKDDFMLSLYFYDGYMPTEEFLIRKTSDVSNLVVEKISG